MEDFVLDTQGHCFICLNEIPSVLSPVTNQPELGSSTTTSLYSLQCLSRYLKLNMRHVFNDSESTPVELLGKVQRAHFKVQLCLECASLNEIFSMQWKQLEKIEMEVASTLRRIHSSFSSGERMDKTKEFLKSLESDMGADDKKLSEKVKIFTILRKEALKKSSRKLKCYTPQVKLQNMTVRQLQKKTIKLHPHIDCDNIVPNSISGHVPEDKSDEEVGCSESANVKMETDMPSSTDDEQASGDHQRLSDLDDETSIPSDNSCVEESAPVVPKLESIGTSEEGNQPLGWRSPILIAPNEEHLKVAKSMISFIAENKVHKCGSCSKEFKCHKNATLHYRTHLPHRFKCLVCSRTFPEKRYYNIHFQSDHQLVRFKCKGCSKSFKSKGNLASHRRNGARECQEPAMDRISKTDSHKTLAECVTSDTPEALEELKQRSFDQKSLIYKCDQCKGGHKEVAGLRDHYISVHVNHNQCNLCRKQCQNAEAYRIHYFNIHTVVKCNKCSQSFSRYRALRTHRQYCEPPLDNTSFKCSICGTEFTQTQSLKRHLRRVHSKIRNHLCSHCGKEFLDRQDLERHINAVHLKLRDNLCELCGKGFTESKGMIRHRRNVHRH